LFASLILTGFFTVPVLAQYTGLPAMDAITDTSLMDRSNTLIPPMFTIDGGYTTQFEPIAMRSRSRYSQYPWYNYGGYHSNYYDPHHSYNYWSERYRRESYRYFKPGHVRRNFTFAFPYGYYPMIPPSYTPYSYDQYPRYTQPEQRPQIPQKTKEQIEKEMRAEVTRQTDNISQAFVLGDYNRAIVRAREALKQMPDNTMLRFICSQTLFADGRFQNAAITVRSTLEKMAQTGAQDVFYPMNLYPDQDTLNKQIEKLIEAVNAPRASANLRLLLGYQLLGVGRVDEAMGHLQKASQDTINEKAALYLIKVSSRIYYNTEPKVAPKQAEKPNESNVTAEKPTVAEPKY
jgi:hypothetical protein